MRRYTEWLKRLIREKRASSILTYEHTSVRQAKPGASSG